MTVQTVYIVLNLDHSARSDKDPVCISKKAHDEVCWRCPQGSAVITFKGPNGSPFASGTFYVPEGGSVCSGPVRANAGNGVYLYSIDGRSSDPKDPLPYHVDPKVDVGD